MSMHAKKAIIPLIAMVAIVGAVLLSACGAPALPREQVEQELVSFMLDHTVRQEIGASEQYAQSSGHVWAEAPADANLIVWAPPVAKIDDATTIYLNTDEPTRVWWYADRQLAEVTDRTAAIESFRKIHFSGTPSNKGWGYYEFGILSLERGNTRARVYLGVSCGPLCGEGTIYILQRTESGQWEIKETQPRWIS